MKTMKSLYSFVVLALTALVFTACSDSTNFLYQDVDAPKILSFGFYEEDNPEFLSSDHVVDLSGRIVSGTSTVSVDVPLPSTVDKSSLIARFTTSDGAVVKVNGVEQTSQSTANNFKIPVDYIVSKGSLNVRYAVTVTKGTNMKWLEAPAFADLTVFGDPVMKINPQTHEPYVGFKVRTDNDYRPVVIKLTDNGWEYVGSGPFGNKISSSYFDMDLNADGVPFVGYSDNTASTSGALTVQDFTNGTWQFTGGSAGVLNAQSNYLGIAVLANGEIVGAQVNNSTKSDYVRRTLVVSNYKDGGWTSQTPSMLTNLVYMSNVAGGSKAAYVISINRGMVSGVNCGYNVLKYENGEWTAMILNYLEPGNTPNFNNISTIGVYVAPDETPYIWTLDDASGAAAIRMKYYDSTTDSWLTLGGNVLPLGFAPDRHTEVALAVTNDGTPYIVYNNLADQGYPYFMYLDQETQQWSSPVKIADISATGLSIGFAKTGVGYVTFTDDSSKVRIFKYE
ncbi:hypothetical protein [Prevotella sp. KH2C16]|uniref:hypothetical protein n=1 Tax=Prevotella sp. KH2C16 TaxID=1855325 RepID=UPI0008E498F7|nr:hypothetical protein [Prevotella sp. KH2C16]SFF83004.1 hypothetical protein SAMN05216383_101114 [Prevotella sp. KH2C16]